MARSMRFCYLDCEDAEKWAGHEQLAHRILHPDASWEHFRCWNGELPPLEEVSQQFDGVLISGSHYSAYEDRPWIHALEGWLRQAVAQYPHVRFIGMCFGCQILAQALGGRVGKNVSGRFVLGVETVHVLPALQRCSALCQALQGGASTASLVADGSRRGSAHTPSTVRAWNTDARSGISSVRLIESHGDCVLELPPGAVLLADSDSAPVEMWTVPGGNVLAVQGHAELSAADALQKIYPAVTAAGRLSAAEAEESARSLREDRDDAELVLRLYRCFMELGLPEVAAPAAVADKPDGCQFTGARAAAAGDGVNLIEQPPAPAQKPGAAAAGAEGGQEDLAPAPTSIAEPLASTQVEAGPQGCSAPAALPSAAGEAPSSAEASSAAGGEPAAARDSALFSADASPGNVAASAAHLLEQLKLAVGAELCKAPLEQQLLRQCNEAAAARYRQIGDAAEAARGSLEALVDGQRQHGQQQGCGAAVQLVDELEAQVGALEASVTELDACSRRLQARLMGAGDTVL